MNSTGRCEKRGSFHRVIGREADYQGHPWFPSWQFAPVTLFEDARITEISSCRA